MLVDSALDRSQQSELHLKQVAEELRGAADAMAADRKLSFSTVPFLALLHGCIVVYGGRCGCINPLLLPLWPLLLSPSLFLPPPCAVRTQMKEADHAHQGQIEVLKEDMKALKQRSMTATEAMQRMQLEVRARRLESESLTREVNSVAETSEEHEKNLQKAEQSRSALLNELDRTRRDKTDMVKAMVEERNSAADEAGKMLLKMLM